MLQCAQYAVHNIFLLHNSYLPKKKNEYAHCLVFNVYNIIYRYTQGNVSSVIYPIILQWPDDNLLEAACLDKLNIASIVMLDTQSKLKVIKKINNYRR